MVLLASTNGIDLKIVDDPKYKLTQDELAKGTKVAIFTKESKSVEGKDTIGHYQLLGSQGNI